MEYDCILPTRRKLILAAGLLALAPTLRAYAAAPQKPRILVVGDSLSAEYGIRRDSGWVAILQQRLNDAGLAYEMRNASVSGDTTSAGLSRLAAALERHTPAIVIVALGSNDALRGLPLEMTRDNLQEMLEMIRQVGAQGVLAGMRMPLNYGRAYTEAFASMYDELARRNQAPIIPFLLEGVATRPELFQPDQLHPTEQAQPLIADNVWAVLRPLLNKPERR